ncbi:MAG: hypothetical protein IJ748_06610, partial [Bacteroidales bacterium]|nr:hypothetical protein [Bacteroidales bacterium]
ALLIAIVSLGFVSCGDDDEKEDDVSIIGTWCSVFKDEGETAQDILIFNEDGTGTEKIKYSDESDVGKFKYIFDKRAMTLEIMSWNDDDNDYSSKSELLDVKSLTSTTLVIGELRTYYRQ